MSAVMNGNVYILLYQWLCVVSLLPRDGGDDDDDDDDMNSF